MISSAFFLGSTAFRGPSGSQPTVAQAEAAAKTSPGPLCGALPSAAARALGAAAGRRVPPKQRGTSLNSLSNLHGGSELRLPLWF